MLVSLRSSAQTNGRVGGKVGGPYMFELGRVRALDIAKRRVVLHNTRLDQVVQLQRLAYK